MIPSPPLSPSLHSLFDAQHHASRAQADVPLALRRERLLKIRALLAQHGPALAQAVQADFGVRRRGRQWLGRLPR